MIKPWQAYAVVLSCFLLGNLSGFTGAKGYYVAKLINNNVTLSNRAHKWEETQNHLRLQDQNEILREATEARAWRAAYFMLCKELGMTAKTAAVENTYEHMMSDAYDSYREVIRRNGEK